MLVKDQKNENRILFSLGLSDCLKQCRLQLHEAGFETTQLGTMKIFGFRKTDRTRIVVGLEGLSAEETSAEFSIIQ